MQTIKINDRVIGKTFPVYIIAEMSANHNQDYDKAVDLIHLAKNAGADAIKLQTYLPNTLTIDCHNEHFLIGKGTIWEGKNLYSLYQEAYTPWEWQPKLKIVANGLGLDFFSTPFDFSAVDFLENIGVPAYKIASFELVDIPLIRKVAQTGKPIILSTGMATLSEIDEAVQAARDAGASQIALLKCNSAYPAVPEEINLKTIPHMADAFNVPVGLSDHTLGFAVPVTAVALGACMIEKHFTISRNIPGPDSAFSLEPHEFQVMVESVRMAEKSLGKISYSVTANEIASRVFRRSLFVVKDMKSGDVITEKNVRSIRPGYGLAPKYWNMVQGRTVRFDLKRGTALKWEFIDNPFPVNDVKYH